MSEELPKDLAGWQHLAPDETLRIGDLAVSLGKPDWVVTTYTTGWLVGFAEETTNFRFYRRIPVAKQGDLDHKMVSLPTDAAARKKLPVCTGVIDYFPNAILAVAECSLAGNNQHHPDSPLHWDKNKSTDEADALMRHLMQRGTKDTDGIRHSAKAAWRSLALLQREIEAERSQQ